MAVVQMGGARKRINDDCVVEQHETEITGGVQIAEKDEPRHNVELCFTYRDVDAAFKVSNNY